jgi:transcriptional regulator PpsR
VRLGGNAGLLAIGRSLEAVADLRSRLVASQKSMERDYWKLRDVETRYRLLFDASAQPVLFIGADDTRIIEANPAAIRALGVASDCELLPEILAAQRDLFRSMLARVRDQGKAPGIIIHLGPDRQPWLVRASLIAAEPTAVFVLQLVPSLVTQALSEGAGDKASSFPLEDLIARLPEAFLVLDGEGKIVRANRAFLELIEQAEEGPVIGQSLGRWMSWRGADAGVLIDSFQRQPTLSRFATTLKGELGLETQVELSAVGSSDSNPRYFGVLLHRVDLSSEGNASPAAPDAAQQATQVGKSPLREIVQESVAAVERSCIEAALELAKGNRTAAAEMLGLSRQSLYAKLSRYSFNTAGPSGSQ